MSHETRLLQSAAVWHALSESQKGCTPATKLLQSPVAQSLFWVQSAQMGSVPLVPVVVDEPVPVPVPDVVVPEPVVVVGHSPEVGRHHEPASLPEPS